MTTKAILKPYPANNKSPIRFTDGAEAMKRRNPDNPSGCLNQRERELGKDPVTKIDGTDHGYAVVHFHLQLSSRKQGFQGLIKRCVFHTSGYGVKVLPFKPDLLADLIEESLNRLLEREVLELKGQKHSVLSLLPRNRARAPALLASHCGRHKDSSALRVLARLRRIRLRGIAAV